MASIDYVNIDDDLLIADGDFVKGDCTQRHAMDILKSTKGDYKQYPLLGVDLFKSVNGPVLTTTKVTIQKNARLQLEGDGFKILELNTDDLENIIVKVRK